MTEEARRDLLHKVHVARYRAHWGPKFDIGRLPWPKDDAEWRQTPHGAPWDTNVAMAEWHLRLARDLQAQGLLT